MPPALHTSKASLEFDVDYRPLMPDTAGCTCTYMHALSYLLSNAYNAHQSILPVPC